MATIALVVAAGRGQRFGSAIPKQFLPLGGRAVLHHALGALCAHPRIDRVVPVIHPDHAAQVAQVVAGLPVAEPVAGGAERQDSVRLGLEALDAVAPAPERVLIHDAARPFLSFRMIDDVLDALDDAPGAVPVVPVADTLKRVDGLGTVVATVDRSALVRAQTPQGFRFQDILAAHRAAAGQTLTDDAAVAETAGLTVRTVPGDPDAFKITTTADLAAAERLLMRPARTRTGMGYDVHAFGAGDHVTLCGIDVPHDRALVGFSDADVGLHALTDAVLGAIGAGDIGAHFPPGNPAWAGAPSWRFLARAAALVAGLGGTVEHVDVTLICERPRIGPYRSLMRRRISEILEVPIAAVSVKATTTEGLGFTGRREGIAAQAVATVTLPPAPAGGG